MAMNDYAADQDLVHSHPELQKNMADNDPVNHPSHYTSGKFEVIDIIEDQLGADGIRGFCLGNAVKYISRAGKKGGSLQKMMQDLEKAIWYINHYIGTVTGHEPYKPNKE